MVVAADKLQEHSMPTEELMLQGKHREATLVCNHLHFKEIVFPSVFVHVGSLSSLKFESF